MLATVITVHRGKTLIHQLEATTVKDCLIAWAGRVSVEGMTDEARTRLRGDMADFDRPPVDGLHNLWRFESDMGLGGEAEALVIVVETARR